MTNTTLPPRNLTTQTFDLIVIGGGIIGTGIARDAALRGLRVALFEKGDFGGGTTARSTRLIHGGLRYLQHFDFRLVRDDLRERERLLKNAPHLVRPMPFLVPIYRNGSHGRLTLKAGMWLYDLLSFDKSLPRHQMLNRSATLEREPRLNPDGLLGAALYYDAQITSPERLCIENLIEAEAQGAMAFNYTEVVAPMREGRQLTGIRARDQLAGWETEVRGRLIVNATGAWADETLELLTGQPSRYLRRTKGIHIAAPPNTQHALVLFSGQDERLLFLVPWLDYTWVGTTDTDFEGDPGRAHAVEEEVVYLLADAKRAIPGGDWDTVYFSQAGVRALVRDEGNQKPPSAVSRQCRILDHWKEDGPEGLMSVLGGKLTGYRLIAEQTVDQACRKLGVQSPCQTANRPLPGGHFESLEQLTLDCETKCLQRGLTLDLAKRLIALYGARYQEVLQLIEQDPSLAKPLHPSYPDIRAQVHHAIQCEHCRTPEDFIHRRSFLGFTPDQGLAAMEAVVKEWESGLNNLVGRVEGWKDGGS